MRNRGSNSPAFWWRGAVILLPLALLAGIGLYSLRQDRRLAEMDARQRCQDYANSLAATVWRGLQDAPADSNTFSSMDINDRGGLVAVDGSPSKAVVPIPEPQPPSPAQALYDLALKATNAAIADHYFSQLETNRDALSDGGLPLWILGQFQRFKLHPSPSAAQLLCSNAVDFPNFATAEILEHTSHYADIVQWLGTWRRDEAARDFYRSLARFRPFVHTNFWADRIGQSWLVEFRGRALAPIASATVRSVQAEAEAGKPPPYARLDLRIGGDRFANTAGVELGQSEAGPVRVRVTLDQPDLLYGGQRRRTLWFVAIIFLSAGAAMFGLVSAYRGFREQLRLNELKTNFVSSVSHELRAPIASMRLLAEGLDRGKISDPAKQKEYYRLISQESRRLSTLIENVLDFSRIEQGRKTYEMEPTDLCALVNQTITLMSPVAAERGVTLAGPAANGQVSFDCDGLAIQQALINLVDNAIKHSPAGSTVAIGLDLVGRGSCRAGVSLWVEDHGPGIPAAEHGRIFERFYRRGTELRRETQGIGIGLTIVRHIVEGHGGRVIVRSAVGQGSRFTIELPAK